MAQGTMDQGRYRDAGAPPAADLDRLLGRYRWLVFCGLALFGVFLAWLHRFVCDDAFISFNYARSLVEGHGLTWFGIRVEGYSNFLWVLWSALGFEVGVEPALWSWFGGIASFAVTVYATWRIGLRLFPEPLPALLGVLLLSTNFTVLSFATSGLETMLQTALLSLCLLMLVRIVGPGPARMGTLLSLSLVSGLAILTRMDSILPAAVVGIWTLVLLARRHARVRHYATLILPALCLVLPWLIWKQLYYGSVVPNSLHVKVGLDSAAFRVGLSYLARFVHWYLVWPVLVLGTAAFVWRRRRIAPGLWPLVAVVLAWSGYVTLVGGDFIEFRFLVPIAPALFLILMFLTWHGLGSLCRRCRLVLPVLSVAALTAASVYHAYRFRSSTPDLTLDSIHALGSFYGVYPDHDWSRIGRKLGNDLEGTGAVLGLSAVGAIPFYSRLRTVDMLGLTEPNAAELLPARVSERPRPGHRLLAGIGYLREKQVNLLVAHPTPIRPGALSRAADLSPYARWIMENVDITAEDVEVPTLVTMPYDREAGLLMWYFSPTPAIDTAIRNNGWEVRHLPVRLRPERVSAPAG